MQYLWMSLIGFGQTLLLSLGIIAAGAVVVWLGGARRAVTDRVCRIGSGPERIVMHGPRGPVAVTLRTIDRHHVWLRVTAPPGTVVRAQGG